MIVRLKLLLICMVAFLNGFSQAGENSNLLRLKSGAVQMNSGATSAEELESVYFDG